jgi:hypothetical protein
MNRIALSRCVGLVELFLTVGRSAMPEIDSFPAAVMQPHASKGSGVHFLLLCQFHHIVQRFSQVPPSISAKKASQSRTKSASVKPDLLAELEF